MAINSRNKGIRGELAFVKECKKHGYDAQRSQQLESMPKLEIGDIVDANSGLSYVAISPMTLVCRDERKQCNLEANIVRIQRFNGAKYQTIWRADDEYWRN